MLDRRVLTAAAAIGALVLFGVGWALGSATASDDDGDSPPRGQAEGGAVRTIDGVTVGVQPTRPGALAAADNYVAIASESAIQDPKKYERLVRTVYSPGYQQTALREGREARANSGRTVANYARGGKTVVIVGARRLDNFTGRIAQVTSWIGGFTWGPSRKPGQSWSLVETTLRWDGQRWRVDKTDETDRPAPAPTTVGYDDDSALTSPTFDRELRAMTAPIYGAE